MYKKHHQLNHLYIPSYAQLSISKDSQQQIDITTSGFILVALGDEQKITFFSKTVFGLDYDTFKGTQDHMNALSKSIKTLLKYRLIKLIHRHYSYQTYELLFELKPLHIVQNN